MITVWVAGGGQRKVSVEFIKRKKQTKWNPRSFEGSPGFRAILFFLCPFFMLTPNQPTNGAGHSDRGNISGWHFGELWNEVCTLLSFSSHLYLLAERSWFPSLLREKSKVTGCQKTNWDSSARLSRNSGSQSSKEECFLVSFPNSLPKPALVPPPTKTNKSSTLYIVFQPGVSDLLFLFSLYEKKKVPFQYRADTGKDPSSYPKLRVCYSILITIWGKSLFPPAMV